MTLFDWLTTPDGIAATHAGIVLLVAIAGWLQWQTHREVVAQQKLLDGHLNEHVAQDVAHLEGPDHNPL